MSIINHGSKEKCEYLFYSLALYDLIFLLCYGFIVYKVYRLFIIVCSECFTSAISLYYYSRSCSKISRAFYFSCNVWATLW
jgi:hypothetical protein